MRKTRKAVLFAPLLVTAFLMCPALGDVATPLVIDALYISRALGSLHRNHLDADPCVSIHFVPMPGHYTVHDLGMDASMLNRWMRMYMPRSYEDLVGHYDLVILHEAPVSLAQIPEIRFDTKWMSWFVRAVVDEGRSLTMWHGDASWGAGLEGPWLYGSWGETMLDQILPFECFGGEQATWYGRFRPQFLDSEHPLARLPWEPDLLLEEMKKVRPKLGATEIARTVEVGIGGATYPWIAWWRTGKGKVLGEAAGAWENDFVLRPWIMWGWYQDFLIYLAYLAADKPLPSDIYLVHRLREDVNGYIAKVGLAVSVLDFAEKFGANTVALRAELEQIGSVKKTAENHYRMNEYEETGRLLQEVHSALDRISTKAVEIKDRALFWVYLAEWLVVTGACLISGFVLWSLMVRRRLYREVVTTRGKEEAG